MGKIEKEFGALKEKYFANKAASIQNEIELIESGKHEQFLSREKALRKKMEDALESAARERTYQIHNAQLVYEGEAVQAEKDYQMDRKHLKKKMREALEQRLEELEEEKKNVSVVDYSTKKMTEEAVKILSSLFLSLFLLLLCSREERMMEKRRRKRSSTTTFQQWWWETFAMVANAESTLHT